MPEPSHVLESLPAYALGALTDAEARAVSEHLAACTLCRMELSAFQAVAGQLALAMPELAEPPPDLEGRLMERVRELQPSAATQPTKGRLRRTGPWPLWQIAAALLILALGVSNLLLWQRLNTLEVLKTPQGMRAIALQSTDVAPQASGFVIMGADGKNGVLVVDAMPLLDPAREYQLWLLRGEEFTSGAVFAVDETGYRGVRIMAPDSLLAYSGAHITIEPAEGSPQPTGEPVMAGILPAP